MSSELRLSGTTFPMGDLSSTGDVTGVKEKQGGGLLVGALVPGGCRVLGCSEPGAAVVFSRVSQGGWEPFELFRLLKLPCLSWLGDSARRGNLGLSDAADRASGLPVVVASLPLQLELFFSSTIATSGSGPLFLSVGQIKVSLVPEPRELWLLYISLVREGEELAMTSLRELEQAAMLESAGGFLRPWRREGKIMGMELIGVCGAL